MGFNLYLAAQYSRKAEPLMLDIGVNRLYSQLNDRPLGEKWLKYSKEVERRKIFVDSGAYSVHTKGKTVDVDEYIEYVNSHAGMFEGIAQVDKIPGEFGKPKTLEQLATAPEESWNNYLYMREKVIDKHCLIPIFHQGEDFKWLRNTLEWIDDEGNHIPYIGISPANDLVTKHKETWFATVFKIIKESNNPDVKTHAFGMTSLPMLEKYPFYSADSTSWIMTSVNGGIFTPYGVIQVTQTSEHMPNHFIKCGEHKKQAIIKWLESFGMTYEECRMDYNSRAITNVHYFVEWSNNYKFKGDTRYQKRLF